MIKAVITVRQICLHINNFGRHLLSIQSAIIAISTVIHTYKVGGASRHLVVCALKGLIHDRTEINFAELFHHNMKSYFQREPE